MCGQHVSLLSLNDVSVTYRSMAGPVRAVDKVSFEMESGETVGIVGESACGKSTLGLAIMRMLQGGSMSGGSIKFQGVPLYDIPPYKFDNEYRWKRISMIFQGAMSSLDPVYTVQKQFTEALVQHGIKTNHTKTISDAIGSVSLDGSVLGRYPHELSGGMKQRVIIALALMLRPELVIADEPTTALDVLVQARIMNMLKGLKQSGTSFLFITHDLALLSEIADKIGIMYAGQLVEFGSARDIYTNPQHPYTRGLLASVPRLRGMAPTYITGTPPDLLRPPSRCRFMDRCCDATEKCRQDPPVFHNKNGRVKCWLYE